MHTPLSRGSRQLLAVTAAALLAGPAHPPPMVRATHPQAYSFVVSPSRMILPPASGPETRVFSVLNLGKRPLAIRTSVAQYTQQPDGAITFSPPGPLSATSWVHVRPATFVIRPGTTRRVQVQVMVPPHPEPGERDLGVIFRAPPYQASRNVKISGAIGAEMLINVPGPIVHKITLSGLSAPAFSAGGNIPLTVTIRNHGTVHQQYAGRARLTADAGAHRIKFPGFILLSASTRIITTHWASHPWMCLCTVRVTTTDGHGHLLTASTRIVIFPIWTVLGALLVATGLLIAAARIRRRTRAKAARHAHEPALP